MKYTNYLPAIAMLVTVFATFFTACTRTASLPTDQRSAKTGPQSSSTPTAADSLSTDPMVPALHFPMKEYLNDLAHRDSLQLFIVSAQLNDPNTGGPGQEELGFAFRCSKNEVVYRLALHLPYAGYSHTVTIWDSATAAVVAQARVDVTTSGWSYSNTMGIGADTTLLANHGYIIGFNSKAIGVPLGTSSPGNESYLYQHLYDLNQMYLNLPWFPFTRNSITYEGSYILFYDTPIDQPPFPGNTDMHLPTDFVGACDLGIL